MSAVPGRVEDPSALLGEDVELPGADGATLRAYLARPRGVAGTTRPGLIVVHEAFGLNEHIRDVARRFANVGYQALAPDLYTREGPPPEDDREALFAALRAQPDARVVADLEGAAAFLRELPGASGRLGCIGFCSGGRLTLLYACGEHPPGAAVDCWGGSITRAFPDEETTPGRPVPPIELADRLGCPVLLVAGAEDANPSPEDVEAFARRARAAGHEATVQVYQGAGHAFFADYRPTYRPEAAARLWPELLAFLDAHLH